MYSFSKTDKMSTSYLRSEQESWMSHQKFITFSRVLNILPSVNFMYMKFSQCRNIRFPTEDDGHG